uniref:Carboxy-S-adenosyl-L-methionine synthase n=1 Tax=uncultured Thiotrichaceae bacterium TaxID=298394 RepID=A0A6S6TXJ9_9GAMM|nr:MAG: tRNA (uridine-5-oxyacetic acid methyl ester) 34 synthase [uncultured Thiotrichaceae bacterium]
MSRDELFANPQQVVDFVFNAEVADVFPDMLRRSVPGYETLISQLGVLARHYVQADSKVYDLGCSLGAATLSMASQTTPVAGVRFIGVDNSEAMISRCEQRLARHLPTDRFELHCDDICSIPMDSASLMVLNFTLQFVEPEARQALLDKLYQALLPGGALILSEKTKASDESEQTLINDLYLEFKRSNGYSEMEISQKRSALEKVMIPDTVEIHIERLKQAGFSQVSLWFRSFSFVSILAVK